MEKRKTVEAMNIHKEPITIKHADLERYSDSPYKSICPVCNEGLLLVSRNRETFQIESNDMCILCGQHVIYEDLP